MKKALITGITGQDGSYLAEFLLEKGYEVHGIVRRASISTTGRIDHLIAAGSITLHEGDLCDSSSIVRVIQMVQPDEIYNLAAQSHVQVSFDAPEYSGDVDALGVTRVLEVSKLMTVYRTGRSMQRVWIVWISKGLKIRISPASASILPLLVVALTSPSSIRMISMARWLCREQQRKVCTPSCTKHLARCRSLCGSKLSLCAEMG